MQAVMTVQDETQNDRIIHCILKATAEAAPAKLQLVRDGTCKVSYNLIHNTNQLVLYERRDIPGDHLDMKDTYLFYLTLRDILGEEVASRMAHFFCDLNWMKSFIKYFRELNINPFAEIEIAEIGGRNSTVNNENPVFLFISTFFKSYKNINADQEAKASIDHANFVTINNYKTFFGEQKFDYVWTSNVMSFCAISAAPEVANGLIYDLFKVCSLVTKPGGQIFHITGYDDFNPAMRSNCLSDANFHAECGLKKLSPPNNSDYIPCRVNIFAKQ